MSRKCRRYTARCSTCKAELAHNIPEDEICEGVYVRISLYCKACGRTTQDWGYKVIACPAPDCREACPV